MLNIFFSDIVTDITFNTEINVFNDIFKMDFNAFSDNIEKSWTLPQNINDKNLKLQHLIHFRQ